MSTDQPDDVTPPNESSEPTEFSREDASAPMIRLDDLIKRTGLVGTGGEAKIRIQSGEVLVNGEVETRRRKQLHLGDVVEVIGETIHVTSDYFD